MRIAVIGGTGKEGGGMALRWAHAGHDVFVGSRDAAKAQTVAAELGKEAGRTIRGGSNADAIAASEIAVLSVPYPAHARDRKSVVSGKRGSVRVDLGGRRIIKKKKPTRHKEQ